MQLQLPNQTWRGVTLAALLSVSAGCASSGQVNTQPPSSVMRLTQEYSVSADLGQGPVEVQEAGNLARYKFFRPGQPNEYLLVLFPEDLDETITVNLSGTQAVADAADAAASGQAGVQVVTVFDRYFDLLLRAHRRMLAGQLEEAERIVDRLDAKFTMGFGSAVLRGNVALVRGRLDQARYYYGLARSLVPDAPELAGVTPATGGG